MQWRMGRAPREQVNSGDRRGDISRPLVVALGAGILLSVIRQAVHLDARWWTLVMAAFLVVMLAIWVGRGAQNRK
jgi:hypothetical protein